MSYDIDFGNSLRSRLTAARDHLEQRLREGVGSRDLAPTIKQYVEVIEKLNALPDPREVSEVGNILGAARPRVPSRGRVAKVQPVSTGK